MPRLSRFVIAGLIALVCLETNSGVVAQDGGDSGVIDFETDVKPILENRCMECHSAEDPKDDLDFSEVFLVVDDSYVVPGDAANSLFYERITTDNEDKLMPPVDSGGRLPASEIAILNLWMEEGAHWPEEIILQDPARANDGTPTPPTKSDEPDQPKELSMFAKVWKFQGYFHYAVIHFPIALVTISAVFVLLNWIFAGPFKDAAFYCLLFGALSCIPACTMGWSLAPTEGYAGIGNERVFWHRWVGIGVSIGAIVISVLAIRARKSDRARGLERAKGNLPWQIAVLLLAGLIGWVGHQGGELVHGKSHYIKAFSLFDTVEPVDTTSPPIEPDGDTSDTGSGDTGSVNGDGSDDESAPGATSSEDDSSDDVGAGDVGAGDDDTGDDDAGNDDA